MSAGAVLLSFNGNVGTTTGTFINLGPQPGTTTGGGAAVGSSPFIPATQPSATVGANGYTPTGLPVGLDPSRIGAMALQLNVTTAVGSSPTFNVYLQHSLDGGSTWADFVAFGQVTTSAIRMQAFWVRDIAPTTAYTTSIPNLGLAAGVLQGPVGDNWRVAYVVGGSYTNLVATLTARQIQKTRG